MHLFPHVYDSKEETALKKTGKVQTCIHSVWQELIFKAFPHERTQAIKASKNGVYAIKNMTNYVS